jgi:hypothetical protein
MKPSLTTTALVIAALAITALFTSCAGLLSGVTGQPVPAVPVQRVDGDKPFAVAAADVFQAETQPGKVWGLYDAGAVASVAGQVVESGK